MSEQSFDVSHKIPSVSRPFCRNKIKKKEKRKIDSDVASPAFFFFSQARYSIVSLLVFLLLRLLLPRKLSPLQFSSLLFSFSSILFFPLLTLSLSLSLSLRLHLLFLTRASPPKNKLISGLLASLSVLSGHQKIHILHLSAVKPFTCQISPSNIENIRFREIFVGREVKRSVDLEEGKLLSMNRKSSYASSGLKSS